MSDSYIRDLAIGEGLKHWHAKRRPELTPVVATERLLWCQCRAYWKTKKWREYMWNDEYSVELGKEGEVVWVWGHSTNKWKPIYIEMYKKVFMQDNAPIHTAKKKKSQGMVRGTRYTSHRLATLFARP